MPIRQPIIVGWWVDVSGTKPQSVADVSSWWGGRGSIGALELRPSGARQQPARVKQGAQQHQDHHREENRRYEARSTTLPTGPDPPPFEEERRNHSRRHHLPDRIMSRGGRDARFRSSYLGPVGDAGSAVTPPQFRQAQTLGEEKGAHCVLRRAFHY